MTTRRAHTLASRRVSQSSHFRWQPPQHAPHRSTPAQHTSAHTPKVAEACGLARRLPRANDRAACSDVRDLRAMLLGAGDRCSMRRATAATRTTTSSSTFNRAPAPLLTSPAALRQRLPSCRGAGVGTTRHPPLVRGRRQQWPGPPALQPCRAASSDMALPDPSAPTPAQPASPVCDAGSAPDTDVGPSGRTSLSPAVCAVHRAVTGQTTRGGLGGRT